MYHIVNNKSRLVINCRNSFIILILAFITQVQWNLSLSIVQSIKKQTNPILYSLLISSLSSIVSDNSAKNMKTLVLVSQLVIVKRLFSRRPPQL